VLSERSSSIGDQHFTWSAACFRSLHTRSYQLQDAVICTDCEDERLLSGFEQQYTLMDMDMRLWGWPFNTFMDINNISWTTFQASTTVRWMSCESRTCLRDLGKSYSPMPAQVRRHKTRRKSACLPWTSWTSLPCRSKIARPLSFLLQS
jgi:hypothetical protein